jgi:hypothetical protein
MFSYDLDRRARVAAFNGNREFLFRVFSLLYIKTRLSLHIVMQQSLIAEPFDLGKKIQNKVRLDFNLFFLNLI